MGNLAAFEIMEERGPFKFSGIIRADPPLDDSEDLIETARGEFKKAEGARKRPDAARSNYSNTCQSTAIYRR